MDLSFAALQWRREVKMSSDAAPRRKGMVCLHKTDQFNGIATHLHAYSFDGIDLHRYTDRFDGVEDHRSARLAFAMEIHLN